MRSLLFKVNATDKYNNASYSAGDVVVFEDDRAEEILNAGDYAVEVFAPDKLPEVEEPAPKKKKAKAKKDK